ncbi:MAG: outer membrane protein assembly factor BamA, partial [Bacteroidales bacterium]|nr:outer membrane protein assembly factor BamA [Bacteroidales bacterium]
MNIKNKILWLMFLLSLLPASRAQIVVGGSSGGDYDIDYLTPKKYEIGGITLQGAENLDQRMVLMVADLHVGDKVQVPGDRISGAIDKLWKQGLFEDVKIEVANIQNDLIFLNIELVGRPKLSRFQFRGVKKSDADKLRENLNLMVGDVVTDNLMITSKNKILSYYLDKGYNNVSVNVQSITDTARKNNEQILVFDVNSGKKARIKQLYFEGNEAISDTKLASAMKNTHDVSYWKKLRFWTSGFWKRSKYIESDYNKDLEEIITLYNEKGYRDAKILGDSIYYDEQGKMRIKVNIYEGRPYYFRNITFTGNTIYSSDELAKHLRIDKGTPYNKTTLDQNLSYNPSGTDINSLYMDNGYLFFRATPTEVAVENDSIDIEIRIREGSQARLNNVSIKGNTMTNDKVIMREIRTRPGDLFSRDAVIRSVRELATLQYFDEQKINPDVKPNPENGTVDIEYQLEEKSTSQISLSGGWGSGMIIGTLGLSFNNFSVRNIFNKKAWSPLPTGDGQKLYLSAQTNGTYYYSLSAGFTEPWLGGSKPQSLSFSVYHSLYSNGY